MRRLHGMFACSSNQNHPGINLASRRERLAGRVITESVGIVLSMNLIVNKILRENSND